MICTGCHKDNEYETLKIHTKIGYGSKYDGDFFDINFCGECADAFIELLQNGCEINPIVKSQQE